MKATLVWCFQRNWESAFCSKYQPNKHWENCCLGIWYEKELRIMTTVARCQSDVSRGWLGLPHSAQSFSHRGPVGFLSLSFNIMSDWHCQSPFRRGEAGLNKAMSFHMGGGGALTQFQHHGSLTLSVSIPFVWEGGPENSQKGFNSQTYKNRDLIWIWRRMMELLFDLPEEQQGQTESCW